METALAIEQRAVDRVSAGSLPWYVVALAVGATSVVVGVLWDISWHRTIGRDTFWTPAHMAIYLGGVLGGFGGGWLALRSTFGQAAQRGATVRFWGFRAPLGAWVAIWGAFAMLTSAPFDDWWHNAYGLDVRIVSPPHMVLAAGVHAIIIGALLLALGHQNRTGERDPARALAYLYVGGMLLSALGILLIESTRANQQHGTEFYAVCCAVLPFVLVATARAGRLRWPATTVAAVYMGLNMLMIWILPLFPAEPMLGPIWNPVDHMVAGSFPLVLVAPALALDLAMRRLGTGRDWTSTLVLGTVFFAVFLVVQWFFAELMLSPAAENWFFAGDNNWSYSRPPGPWRYELWGDPLTLSGAAASIGLACVSTRLGLWWGNWMARVKR